MMAGVGSCPWCEIPCMDIDLAWRVWPLASFLQQDWEWERVAASEAERQGTSYSPAHSLGTRRSILKE